MSTRTKHNQFEFSSQPKPESISTDSKATSTEEFEVAVALFKSFFHMPGLNLKAVEQLNKLEKKELRVGLLTIYGMEGKLSYDRPPTGDYTRYMMDIHTPDQITVSVYTDGVPISFKLKAKGELECTPSDESQMFGSLRSALLKPTPGLEEHKSDRAKTTTGSIRASAEGVTLASERFEEVMTKVQTTGMIEATVSTLASAKSLSDRLSAVLPNISEQVKGVMSVLGITCGVLLATVTVVLLICIVKKVMAKMTKEKALQVLAAAAGVLVIAGITCHEFSTAGITLGRYASWLKEKWTASVRDVGSIAWNITAPKGEELYKRMSREGYCPARHSLLVFELSETICSLAGWQQGLQFLMDNIRFMPPSNDDESMSSESYTFMKAVHERSFSTITPHVIESMGSIHGLDDMVFIAHLQAMSSRDHQAVMRSSAVEDLSTTVVKRVQVINSAVLNFCSVKRAIALARELPHSDFSSDGDKRRAEAHHLAENCESINILIEQKKTCKRALDHLGISNAKTRSIIRDALSKCTGDSWSRVETFDYTKPIVLPKSIADKPVSTEQTQQLEKEEQLRKDFAKEWNEAANVDAKKPTDEAQGNDNRDGLYSLFALGLALVRKFQNPRADTWELFKKLRADSANVKVSVSGIDFLTKLVPDSLRVAAFAAVGYGDPEDITKAQRDIIARAFHIHKFMTSQKAHTTSNKIVWKTAFDSLADLMTPEFLSQKSSYTLSLANKAYRLMCDQLPLINNIPDTAGHRPCTIGVWLHGVPGCGKSTLCSHLAQSLFADHPPNLRRHTWALDQKYISGFKSNHASIEIDDLGSNIPALQNCDFWGQALTMLSTKPVTVDQADLQSKGMSFNAFAMFLQSNDSADTVLQNCTAGHFLTNPEAVKRRFRGNNGVLARVVLQDAYKDSEGNADEVKIAAAAATDPAQTPWVKYEVEGELLDYDAFVARIVGCLTAALYEYKRNCEAVKPGCHVNDYLLQTLTTAREDAGIDETYGLFPNAADAMRQLDEDLMAPCLDAPQMLDQYQMQARVHRAAARKSKKATPFYASQLVDVKLDGKNKKQLIPGKLDTRPTWSMGKVSYPCGYWEETKRQVKPKSGRPRMVADLLWNSAQPISKTATFKKHSVPFGHGTAEEQEDLAEFCNKLQEVKLHQDGSFNCKSLVASGQFLNDTETTMSVSRVPRPDQCCSITWSTRGTATTATVKGLPNHPDSHCASHIAQIRDDLLSYVTSLEFCALPVDVQSLPDSQRDMYVNLLASCPGAAKNFLDTVLGVSDEKGLTEAEMEEWKIFADGRPLVPRAKEMRDQGKTLQEFYDSFKIAANKANVDKMEAKEAELVAGKFLPNLLKYPTKAVRTMSTIIDKQWLSVKKAYDKFVTALARIDWKTVAKALGIMLGVSAVAYGGFKLFQDYTSDKEEIKAVVPTLGTGVLHETPTPAPADEKDPVYGVYVEATAKALMDDIHKLKLKDTFESKDDRDSQRSVLVHRGIKPTTSKRPQVKPHFKAVDTAQMSTSEEPYLRKVVQNTCSFSPHTVFNEKHHGAALFIIGRRLLMNAHYIGSSASRSEFPKAVTVRQQGQDFHALMRWEDLDFLTNKGVKTDFMVWRMPAGAVTIPDHPKIYQHFPRESELQEVYLRTPYSQSHAPYFLRAHTDTVERHDLDIVRVTKDERIYNNNLDGQEYKMPFAASYSSKKHSQGWCGSLIVTPNAILGVHAIGRNMDDASGFSTGIAQVFTFEMFANYMRDKPQMMIELDESSNEQAPVNSKFGTLADKRGLKPGQAFMEFSLPAIPPTATRTRYVTTGLAERGSILAQQNEKVPSVLHYCDPRYTGSATSGPEFQASLLLRYENPAKGLEGHRPLLQPKVLESINAKLSDIPARLEARVWTLDEALNPRRCGSVLNPLPRSTSAGLLHKGPGKKHYIGYDEDQDLYFAQGGLEGKVASFLSTVAEGKLPLTIYAEFCKDELRTPKKIAATSARTISGSPLTLTMVTTMCYGAFLDAFQRAPHFWGHTVGVDIMGREWDAIIKKLKSNSTKGFDGDFKAFDTTMSYQFMHSFFEHVDKWYKVNGTWSKKDRALRWACMYSLCFSKHACGRTVFTMFSGMCSGSRLTTIMNCFWSKALIMYAYASLAPDNSVLGTCNLTLDGFDRFVVCYVLGDDNFGSVKPEIEYWFNPASISKALWDIGITYTPANKNAEHSEKLRPVEDLEFLANTTKSGVGFDFIPFMDYYPHIKTSSLAKMVAFMKPSGLPGRDACSATADNLTAALLAVHLSGEERFDMVRQSVKVFRDLYPHSEHKFPTFQELCLKYYPLQQPEIVDQYQGITLSKTSTNVTNVQSSGVELNQDNSLETKTAVDARAGLDAPNVPVCQVAALQQGAPFPASAETVTFAPVMGITPVLEKPDTSTINTGNDMDLQSLMRMTWRDTFEWKATAPEGEILWQTRICPNGQLLDESFGLNQVMQPTALASVSSLYRYWHGGIKLSFSAVMSGVHVGRLGICVIYGSNTFPTNFSELTEQRYAVAAFDGMNKDVTIVLPYVATRRLKQVLTGSSQDEIAKCCTGTVSIFVMNQLRAPQSAATGITVNVSEGAAEDFKLYVPGANPSTTYLFDALETPDLKQEQKRKVKEYESRNRDVYQMMSTETPQAMTSQTGADVPVVMSSVSDSAVLPMNPIIKTPQTLLLLFRRQYVFGNNVNGVSSTLRSCTATAPFAVGGLARANLEPWNRLTDMHKYAMYFRCWFGPGHWCVYDQSGKNGISMSFHPTVTGPVQNPGPFNSGTAQYGSTAFSGAWMFAPPRMGFANAVSPFTTTNHVLKVPHFEKELDDDANTGAMQFQISDATERTAFTFSGGDGLHFAVRFAIPLMKCGNTAIQPDTWSSPAADRLRQIRDQYQMDTGSVSVTGSDKVGVTLLEQDNQEVEEVHSVVPNTSDTKIIGQPQLDFCHFLERDQWIANFEWKTNDPIGELLYDRPVPFGMFKNTAQRAIDAFRYFKMDAVVTVKVQATQFHQGRLCLLSMPMTDEQSIESVLFALDAKYALEVPVEKRRVNWTFGNHAFVDAAASSTVTFTIPYRYIRPYLEKNENFARFYITVFNPLRVGVGGSVAASCTVFVHFERCDLRVINPL